MDTMRRLTMMLAAGAAMLGSLPASAITFQTGADRTAALASTRYTGVGSLAEVSGGGIRHSCTAALIASNVVLTATHCLDSNPAYKFVLPAAGDAMLGGTAAIYDILSSQAVDGYRGFGHADLALITLAQHVTGHAIYDIYTGRDEVGQVVTMVGAGMSGLLGDGASFATTDTRLREGVNRYDATGSILAPVYGDYYGDDVLLTDNDSGLAVNDVFGRFAGINDLGVVRGGRVVDAGLIYGDSGGPDFIDGRIAGIHSFAGSGSFLEGTGGTGCGQPGSADTVAAGSLGCTDGSYGDFAGSIRVSFYADVIRAYVASAAAVPEPTSWAMMIVGIGAAGTSLRRRRGLRLATA